MVSCERTFAVEVHEHDIETAFLNGEIEEEIYMEQPDGHEVRNDDGSIKVGPNGRPLVCRLISAIYGTKQAGRQWYHAFKKPIMEYDERCMQECDVDPCLFSYRKGEAFMFVAINVDNLFIMSTHHR